MHLSVIASDQCPVIVKLTMKPKEEKRYLKYLASHSAGELGGGLPSVKDLPLMVQLTLDFAGGQLNTQVERETHKGLMARSSEFSTLGVCIEVDRGRSFKIGPLSFTRTNTRATTFTPHPVIT